METIKSIAERILGDLFNDLPLTNILLKAKIYAVKRGDNELKRWIENELSGYDDHLPSYRILDAGVKVDIHRGLQVITNFEFPIALVKEETIKERLYRFPVHQSISEIEEIINSAEDSSTIHLEIPVQVWYHHMQHCITGNIQRAYQYSTIAALNKIKVSVKSLLIDYFLKVEENELFDFSTLMKSENKEITMHQTINASVVNTGSGNVHASHVMSVIGDNNIISLEHKDELLKIVDQIDGLLQSVDNEECKELIVDIKKELSDSTPKPKFLKRCFQALKGLGSEITTTVISTQISSLIAQAIAML